MADFFGRSQFSLADRVTAKPPLPLRNFWNEVGRHGAAYFGAEGLAKGGVYLLFVWLATLMSVSDFGLLNVFVSVLTLLGVIVGLGLPEGVMRFYFRDGDFRAVVAYALAVPLAVGAALLLLVGPWRDQAGAALNMPAWLLLLAIVAGPLVAFRQIGLSILRARSAARAYFVTRVVEPALLLAGVVILVIAQTQISYGRIAIVYLVAMGGAALAGVLGGVWRIGLRWGIRSLPALMKFSVPLVTHGFAMTGLALFDQVVLQQLLGSQATGTYAFAYRFGMAMSLLVFGVAVAWSPLVLGRLRAGRSDDLGDIASTSFSILIVASVVLAWGVPPAAAWLGGPRYAEALSLIPLVVYAYLWLGLYGFTVPYFYHRERSGALAASSGTAFGVNAVLNYLTIPLWGPTAAAVTTIIGYVLVTLLVWRALGPDRSGLPFGRLITRACIAAPLVLSAAVVFG
jgi:O-antigen/teichoic acid export membrane protein